MVYEDSGTPLKPNTMLLGDLPCPSTECPLFQVTCLRGRLFQTAISLLLTSQFLTAEEE